MIQPNQQYQAFPRLDSALANPDGTPTQGWQWVWISAWQKLGCSFSTAPTAAFLKQSPGLPVTMNDALSGDLIGHVLAGFTLLMPPEFEVVQSGNPSDPVETVTLVPQDANSVWAGPAAGGPATPGFRPLVLADLPPGVGAISISDGTTTVLDVEALDFIGAIVSTTGHGEATITIAGGFMPWVNGDINSPSGGLDQYPGIMMSPDGQMIGVPL